MRFKEFLQREQAGGGDKGLLGSDPKPMGRKPSDGQPFAQYLSDFKPPEGGQSGGMGAGGGGMGGFSMMLKKMKKMMKKKMQKQ